MDYFKILNLKKEPFSNSPDPEFFFHSRQHQDCLQKLELSLLLRRGLNVVIGDVGTGKTTLCRQLIRRFSQQEDIETHLILDPHVLNATGFLAAVNEMFSGNKPTLEDHEWQIKEQIKKHLFRKGVDQNKTVVLIIDEGQKIPVFCLEILREFLNYETNEHKLLQIVIFAQNEFEGTIRKYPNFADRINLYHALKPLSFRDTRLMIKFRLEKSCSSSQQMRLFTWPALWMIYRISGGYPRKIINLCHQSILAMIIQNRSKCGYMLLSACARRVFPEDSNRRRLTRAAVTAVAAAAVALLIVMPSNRLRWIQEQGAAGIESLFSREDHPPGGHTAAGSAPRTFKAQIAASGFDDRPQDVRVSTESSNPAAPAPAEAFSVTGQADPRNAEADPRSVRLPLNEPVTQNSTVRPPLPPKAIPETPVADAVQDTSADVLTASASKPGYSSILGRITIRPNETLSRVITSVYGNFNSKYFKSFIMANPDIEDPDRIDVGQIISLPAIPVRVKPQNGAVWWVRVDDRDSLEAAFNILRRFRDETPGLRLIPYWNPSHGTRFAVLLDELFEDEPTARRQMRRLPVDLVDNLTIFRRWDQPTVYFADPYFN